MSDLRLSLNPNRYPGSAGVWPRPWGSGHVCRGGTPSFVRGWMWDHSPAACRPQWLRGDPPRLDARTRAISAASRRSISRRRRPSPTIAAGANATAWRTSRPSSTGVHEARSGSTPVSLIQPTTSPPLDPEDGHDREPAARGHPGHRQLGDDPEPRWRQGRRDRQQAEQRGGAGGPPDPQGAFQGGRADDLGPDRPAHLRVRDELHDRAVVIVQRRGPNTSVAAPPYRLYPPPVAADPRGGRHVHPDQDRGERQPSQHEPHARSSHGVSLVPGAP